MGANQTGGFRVGRGITDVIAVDVDGTLLLWPERNGGASAREIEAARRHVGRMAEASCDDMNGVEASEEDRRFLPRINAPLVKELKAWAAARAAAGGNPHFLFWTMGGEEHAELAMILCGFDMGHRYTLVGKPDIIVDDAGQALLSKKHPVVLPSDFKCPGA